LNCLRHRNERGDWAIQNVFKSTAAAALNISEEVSSKPTVKIDTLLSCIEIYMQTVKCENVDGCAN